jgi:hypothetical protein
VRRLIAGTLLALVVAVPVSADHAGIGWRTGDIRLATNVLGTGMEPYLRSAIEAWDQSPYISITIEEARPGNVRYNGVDYPCKKQRGVLVVCAASATNYNFAMLDYSGGYLSGVFAGILYTEYQSSNICHEIGHGLGLRHTADHDSCMYSWETDGIGGPQAPVPSVHDLDMLAAIYGP